MNSSTSQTWKLYELCYNLNRSWKTNTLKKSPFNLLYENQDRYIFKTPKNCKKISLHLPLCVTNGVNTQIVNIMTTFFLFIIASVYFLSNRYCTITWKLFSPIDSFTFKKRDNSTFSLWSIYYKHASILCQEVPVVSA